MGNPEDTKPGGQTPRPRPLAPKRPLAGRKIGAGSAGRGAAGGKSQDDLLQRLIPIFRAEADERLQAVEQSLLELEKAAPGEARERLIESVMRDAHSIKGGARTVNLTHVEGICQSFESVAHKMKQHELELSPELFDALHGTADVIGALLRTPDNVDQGRYAATLAMLQALERGELVAATPTLATTPPAPAAAEIDAPAPLAAAPGEVTPIILDRPLAPATPPPAAATPERIAAEMPAAARQDTIRVATEKLDGLFRQAQEMLAVKLTTTQRCADIRDLTVFLDQWRQQWSRVDTEMHRLQAWLESVESRQDTPMAASAGRLIEFLDWAAVHFKGVDGRVRALSRAAEQDRQSLGLMVDNLLEDTRKVLMMPFASLLDILPRMVRDLSRIELKQVELDAQGSDIEIDKRILEGLRDPLVHLVRNCVDHGIELPDHRERAGKPRGGVLRVSVAQVGSDKVELTVADDGRGIDTNRVIEEAVKGGIVTAEDAARMTAAEAIQLIFRSGLSTSRTVTRISGRGLGMSIVREKVEKLGGRLVVESAPGVGTTFRIVLPLTLATLRGVLVSSGGQSFVIPTVNVERVARVRRRDIQIGGSTATVMIGEEPVPLAQLDQILSLPRSPESGDYLTLALVAAAGERVAFAIDEVENEQEVLFRGLGEYLAHLPNIAGATMLGSGKVVPILNPTDLVHAAVGFAAAIERGEVETFISHEVAKSILVAEDSITSRMLLKEILEAAGYLVTTAVDGADALSRLEDATVDLVVSDVEMPRLNGFELTERIRSHPRHGLVPVILVTGLERQRDRERGADAGASAYIVKSSFDQSNLLETIQRLL
ncbi:MAG TPA: response regulator [Terriglobales bacterium]|nr:response regulator [Terriglobales bacterium]